MDIQNPSARNEIEAAFREETRERIARAIRTSSLYTLVMYPIFIPLDFLVYPQKALEFLAIRLTVVALSIALHFIMRIPGTTRFARYFGMFGYLYTTLSIVLMVQLVNGYSSPYYAGINLVLIAFLFMVPMNVWETGGVCVIVYLAYIVPILLRGGIVDWSVFGANNFFLISTMVLVVVSSRLATIIRRREFVARFELAHANDELKRLDAVKSQFFAGVSHEIRTPLTSIMAPIDSLFRGEVGALTRGQESLIRQVRRNALRLLDLINQMLDFAKFDAKKMSLHLRPVDITQVVHDQVTLFREVCRRKGLTLEHVTRENVPVVFLDYEKVQRIVSNLIRNAVKFTETGGIVIEISHEGCGGVPADEWIAIRVRDTGIGIAASDVQKVFARFQQIDASTRRSYGGTGLGLSIVQESVELQHGRVSLDSIEGEGSVFSVFLPTNLDEIEPDADIDRRQEERRQQEGGYEGPDRRFGPRREEDYEKISVRDIAFVEAESVSDSEVVPVDIPQQRPSTGIRVLYVEDNWDLRNYIGSMLRSFGHAVTMATDGVAGWSLIQEMLPDIVVSDVMMPGIDGFELVRLVKTTKSTQKIPILLITAKSDVDARIEGLEIGADDYLSKPVDIRDLDARINNIVANRRFRDAVTRAEELELRIEQLALGFSRSLELRDGYTAGHSADVLSYGTLIADELGVPVTRTLRDALLLHDIGKLGVPDSILRKPSPLSAEEWLIMKRHPQMGAELLKQFESLADISVIVSAHHERYDGSGYPRGLSGKEIPLEARIISVADAWHAMREDRVYRPALPVETAVRELQKNRGKQFDPEIVDRFLEGLVRRGDISRSVVQKW